MDWLDPAIVGLFIIAILTGFLRGFLREFLSCVTWTIGFVVAGLYASSLAATFSSIKPIGTDIPIATTVEPVNAAPALDMSVLSYGISFACLFFGVVLIGAMFNYYIAEIMKEKPGLVSRVLGSVCGLWRGFLFVILTLFLISLTPFSTDSWVVNSSYASSFQPYVSWLSDQVQPGLNSALTHNRRSAPAKGFNLLQGVGGD